MRLRFSADEKLLVADRAEYGFVRRRPPRCNLCAFNTVCTENTWNYGRPRMRCVPTTRADGLYGYWKQTDKKEEKPCRQANTAT
jgi:hypothetical protein